MAWGEYFPLMNGGAFPTLGGDPVGASRVPDRFQNVRFCGRPVEPRGQQEITSHERIATEKLLVMQRSQRQDVSHRNREVAEAPPEHLEFTRALLANAGMDAAEYRIGPLLRRIPACLRALRMTCVSSAAKALENDPARMTLALNHLLIGSTSFFRDEAVFDLLEREVIPRLIKRDRCVRVWSAACSDGSELYSVAMLFDLLGASTHSYFQGTDCRDSVLAVARRGVYQPVLAQAVRADLAARYFTSHGSLVAVKPELVNQIRWKQDDVLADAPRGLWDMILCRNLAIYLEAQSCEALWKRLIHALAPGGILVVGRAEKPSVAGLIRIGPCIYQKVGFSANL